MVDFLKKLIGIGSACLFNTLTGLYCPGCGGTRAVVSLLRGNIAMSFQYHPLVLYIAAVVFLEYVSWGASRLFHKPELFIRRYRFFTIAAVILVTGNWVIKNYMLVFRGIDLLPPL